jgi:FdhE protein
MTTRKGYIMKKKKPQELDRVIKRINTIEKNRPSHKEILQFVKYIIREQHKIKPLIKVKRIDMNEETAKKMMSEGFPLIDKKEIKLDMDSAATLFKNICRALQRKKDEKIAVEAKKISQALRKKEIDLQELFKKLVEGDKGYLDSVSGKTGLNKWLLTFLAESSINPLLEAYAEKLKGYVDQKSWFKGFCPVCGSAPVLGEIRNVEGVEGGVRFLVCSSCSFTWRFKRLTCPFCGNGDHKKLRYFNTEADGKGYRVDVCEECKKYIKAIDTTVVGEALVPLVEDMGTLHLDILARKEGYKRGVPGILEMEKLEE